MTKYAYDTKGNLTTVTYPDETPSIVTDNPKKTYVYGELNNTGYTGQPNALTGIIDENGVRYASYRYDAQGKAISTEHAGGVEKYSLNYAQDGSNTVITDPLGTIRTTRFTTVLGVVKATGSDQPAGAGCAASASNLGYDTNGNIASRTDFNGNLSCHAYDLNRNLETVRVEGLPVVAGCPADLAAYTPLAGSSIRKVSTQWHVNYRLPSQIDQAGQRIHFDYDAAGNLLQKTVTDTATQQSRTWNYTYNNLGQILTADGPRTDVNDITTNTYYADSSASHKPGDLWTVTNALGHVTTFTAYDANGHLLSLTDPNGLVVSFAYDPRGRLTQKTVDGNATLYTYDRAGNLTQVTQPSGVYYRYTYDAAHRLTDITDALGGKIHYTLDAMGNRTKEEILDAAGTVVKTHSRVYDALSRLAQDIGAYNQTTQYQYDPNGNLTKITDANGHATQQQYDSLDRLIRSTDALNGQTDYVYNALDRLTQVTDANNHSTLYSFNGLGDLTQLDSPNTGTSQYSYDSAGNMSQKTDAGNITANYSYDVLNRLLGIDYPGTEADVVNSYDGTVQGWAGQKGYLSSARRGSIETKQQFDLRGNLTNNTVYYASQSTFTATGYTYNADGQPIGTQVTGTFSPTVSTIQNLYDATGQVRRVQVVESGTNGTATHILADNVVHLPFGPIKSLDYGNGLSINRNYNEDYRLNAETAGSVFMQRYTYDAVGNIATQSDDTGTVKEEAYTYDELDRLVTTLGTHLTYQSRGYGYDPVGNRSTLDVDTVHTGYQYDLVSQRLGSVNRNGSVTTYATNPQGHISQIGARTNNYAPDQRLSSVTQGGVQKGRYDYDAFGRRIRKVALLDMDMMSYDSEGRLLVEWGWLASLPDYSVIQYAYLDGQPLARIDDTLSGTSDIRYYHNNHLGAPLKVSDQQGQTVWSADYDPFGQTTITLAGITQNLRLPGQYFDAETGWHYNMQRYYDPGTGRYLQSDPIGLAGGINTYTYVRNNPLRYIDPLGLTLEDIYVARQLAVETQPDLKFPDYYPIKDLESIYHDPTIVAATTRGALDTWLDDRYLADLNDVEAGKLLDTIIHEAIHSKLDPKDPRQEDNNGKGYPYDQARNRATQRLINEFNRRRKPPRCDKNSMCCGQP
ncbi:RHS repeat-associated core domain-containing protein [Methylomonas sp. LL1]|uniref:RHS repeat-associated core domain-containing protein n=1 Tax=Methylomonas sp. LL1 TaxID=2785785 RepID=UPI001E28AFE8|nr:RHS repeat-associated core domain-containing protein [Methylomonas sp. LL1]